MVTRRLFQARSMTTFEIAARRSFSLTYLRILMSLARNSGNSLRLANHLERHSLLTARRKPMGLVFWPMCYSLEFSAFLAVFFFAAAFLVPLAFEARCLISISSETVMKMWQVRLRIGPALPRAFGMKRLIVGPSPATASFTTSLSARRLWLFSAFAMALFSAFCTRNAAFFGLNATMSR